LAYFYFQQLVNLRSGVKAVDCVMAVASTCSCTWRT